VAQGIELLPSRHEALSSDFIQKRKKLRKSTGFEKGSKKADYWEMILFLCDQEIGDRSCLSRDIYVAQLPNFSHKIIIIFWWDQGLNLALHLQSWQSTA
jgi:hypothetical protein